MKEIKLKKLWESYEEGVITIDEYEKKKKEIEETPENETKEEESIEGEKKEEKNDKVENEKNQLVKKTSDKILIIIIFAIVLLFIFFFSFKIFSKPQPTTIDELHELNLKGKLKPEQGYLYKGVYSFVKLDDFWYTQLVSPKGTRFYDMALRYSPEELEDINIKGVLDKKLFDGAANYYVTFNPNGNDFSHVALAVGDFNQHMVNVFGKLPIAACDKNETEPCKIRPIITCDNTDKVVLYVKEANKTNVYYNDNCIVVEGSGFELVRGIDRILLNFYGIMEQ